jgi:flagellar biosynthesis activator protein FlaF
MYRLNYADIQADAPLGAKTREREILQKSIDLLQGARNENSSALISIEAIHFTSKVWTIFLEDLAKKENELPRETRAALISIGIWILKELDQVRLGDRNSIENIIEISEIIKDGLI